MKSLFHLSMVLAAGMLLTQSAFAQGIGINTTGADPHPSAGLDVDFNNKGFLPPRLTTAQRDAIASPATGLTIFNTTTDCINYRVDGTWLELCGTVPLGSIASLNCAGATNNGTLTSGVAASGVNSVISYTSGNGGAHSGQTVSSTGVTGLTATLSAGTFASGSGTLTYSITGTPSTSGTASFVINIGGQSCTLTMAVVAPAFTCGTSTVTFTYKGTSVTYGTVVGANSKCWLDRNLGASQVATSVTDHLSYGDLFQWGRGDDGHQAMSWSTSNSGSYVNAPQSGQSSSSNPGNYFLSGNQNWYNGSNPNLFWQGVDGTNNPCPSGWRIPTLAEFQTERNSWNPTNDQGAFNSSLKMSKAGNTNPSLIDASVFGIYWTSTVSSSQSSRFYFNSATTYDDFVDRFYGLSVRCIKE